jgi:predicted ABC-type ATPase
VTAEFQSRLRLFAGPNGSGKSTLITALKKDQPDHWLGVYVNADDIEREWKSAGFIDLRQFELDERHASQFWSKLQRSEQFNKTADQILDIGFRQEDCRIYVDLRKINSYLAAAAAEIIRQDLLVLRKSFTFESVMSHRSKVELLHQAKAAGYRVYLYFIATDDPVINVSRVSDRIAQGGHPVDPDKIRKRYVESIELLDQAVAAANRAYIFDNSGNEHILLAEITEGQELEVFVGELQEWFVNTSLWRAFRSG